MREWKVLGLAGFSYSNSLSRVFLVSMVLVCEWTLLWARPASLPWSTLTFLYNLNSLIHLSCSDLVLKGELGDPSSSARLSVFWGIWAPRNKIHLCVLKTPCHISIFLVTYAPRVFLCREASLKIASWSSVLSTRETWSKKQHLIHRQGLQVPSGSWERSWVVSVLHTLTRGKKQGRAGRLNSSGSPEQNCLVHTSVLGDTGHQCNPIPPGSMCCCAALGCWG